MYKKTVMQDLGLNPCTAATIRKKSFKPPPLKKWDPGRGGGGWRGQNQKIRWGIMLSPKMMILHGVRHPISHTGVCIANGPPKRGVCGACACA